MLAFHALAWSKCTISISSEDIFFVHFCYFRAFFVLIFLIFLLTFFTPRSSRHSSSLHKPRHPQSTATPIVIKNQPTLPSRWIKNDNSNRKSPDNPHKQCPRETANRKKKRIFQMLLYAIFITSDKKEHPEHHTD